MIASSSMTSDCGASCVDSGIVESEGSQIAWTKDVTSGELTRTVTEVDGSITTMATPGGGDYNF